MIQLAETLNGKQIITQNKDLQEQFSLSFFELVTRQGIFKELKKLKLFLKGISTPQQLNNFTDIMINLNSLVECHFILDDQKMNVNYFLKPEDNQLTEQQKQLVINQSDSVNKMINCLLNKLNLQSIILDFRGQNIYLNDYCFEKWPIYFQNTNNLKRLELYFNCDYRKVKYESLFLTYKSIQYLNKAIQKCKNTLKYLVVNYECYYFQLQDTQSNEYKSLQEECELFIIDKMTYPQLLYLNLRIPFSSQISPYQFTKSIEQIDQSKLISLSLDSNWIDKQFLIKNFVKLQQLNNIELTIDKLSQQEYSLICNSIRNMNSIVRLKVFTNFSFQLNIETIFQFYQSLIQSKYLTTFRFFDKNLNNQLILSEKIILLKKQFVTVISYLSQLQIGKQNILDLIDSFIDPKIIFSENIWLKIALLTRKQVQNEYSILNNDTNHSNSQKQLLQIIKPNKKQLSINWKCTKIIN